MLEQLLLSPTEAAAALGIKKTRLYQLLSEGALESVKLGRLRKIPAHSLEKFVGRLSESPVAEVTTN